MQRFYVPQGPEGNSLTVDDPEQVHHIRDVLRLKAGDTIEVFDGSGLLFTCRIGVLGRGRLELEVLERASLPPIQPRIAVGCAVPRNVTMDEIVDKLSQLGAAVIAPLRTERVVVKLDDAAQKLARWRKIARASAEQSRRASLAEITEILDLEAFIELSRNYDLKLIPTLEGKRQGLRQIIAAAESPMSAAVLIGPEGDFTPAEVARATAAGFIPVTLGGQVLRVDTAAISIVAYLRLALPAD